MAWSATAKASVSSSTGAASFATGSHTPAANRLLVAVVVNDRSAGTPTLPTVSGNGLTWELLKDPTTLADATIVRATANQSRTSIFAALTGASPSAGAVTADFGGVTQIACVISVFEVEIDGGVPASVAAAVRQVKTGDDGGSTATSGSITLDTAMLSTGRGVAAFTHHANEATTHRASWTEIHDLSHGAPTRGVDTQMRTDAAESTASATWATASNWAGLFVELKQSGGVSVTGSRADETDTALGGTPAVAKPGALAGETDTALAGVPAVAKPGGLAAETDTAFAGTPAVAVAGARADETDTAFAGSSGGGSTVAGSRADETDTAFAGAPTVAATGGRAEETDTPAAGAPLVAVAGTLAVEVEVALAGAPAVVVAGSLATETDEAFGGAAVSGDPRDLDLVVAGGATKWRHGTAARKWTTGGARL